MRTKTNVANNVAMLNLDLTDETLGRYAAEQARVIRRRLCALVAESGVTDENRQVEIADDLYVTWNGAIITWAIDGDGELGDWVQSRIERILDRALPPP